MATGSQLPVTAADTVLFIEAGQLQQATLLSDTAKKLRIVDAAGLERKLDRRKVAARLEASAASTAINKVSQLAAQIDLATVWQQAAGQTQSATQIADLVFPQEDAQLTQLALLLAHSKDGGFFHYAEHHWHPVPQERYEAIMASRKKRQHQHQLEQQWQDEIATGKLPQPLAEYLKDYLKEEADHNDHRHRFLQTYGRSIDKSFAQLAIDFEIVTDFEQYHLRHLAAKLPKAVSIEQVPTIKLAEFTQGSTQALSIDAANTLEVDDAFSVEGNNIGVHIAAPGLGIPTAAQDQAHQRMATIYLPTAKYMMLPEKIVTAYSLLQETPKPAVSLQMEFTDNDAGNHRFVVNQIQVAQNLDIEKFSYDQITQAKLSKRHNANLEKLVTVARATGAENILEPVRGHLVSVNNNQPKVVSRAKFALADRMVAALMILYNRLAAEFLHDQKVPYLQRTQGKLYLGTTNTEQPYGWFTSPLRRWADFVNQQQLLAVINETKPPYSGNQLRALIKPFMQRYTWVMQLQHKLETLWSLRWLWKNPQDYLGLVTEDGQQVMLEAAPVTVRLARPAPPGAQVYVAIERIDEHALICFGEII